MLFLCVWTYCVVRGQCICDDCFFLSVWECMFVRQWVMFFFYWKRFGAGASCFTELWHRGAIQIQSMWWDCKHSCLCFVPFSFSCFWVKCTQTVSQCMCMKQWGDWIESCILYVENCNNNIKIVLIHTYTTVVLNKVTRAHKGASENFQGGKMT